MRAPKTVQELRDLAIEQLTTTTGTGASNDRADRIALGLLGLLGDLKAIEAGTVEVPRFASRVDDAGERALQAATARLTDRLFEGGQ